MSSGQAGLSTTTALDAPHTTGSDVDTKQHVRKQIIALALKHQKPGAGTSAPVLRERTARMRFPDLTRVLHSVQWAMIGAGATRLYMQERATQDLDVVIDVADADVARRLLSDASYRYQGELAIGGSSWLSSEGTPVDVLEMDEPWLSEALDEAKQNVDAQGLPVLPLRYLVLTKFQSGRVQDLADITRMLGQAGEDTLASVRELFGQVMPERQEDLESLIELGRLEMGAARCVTPATAPEPKDPTHDT